MSDGVGNAQSDKAKEAAEREENMKNAILSQVSNFSSVLSQIQPKSICC